MNIKSNANLHLTFTNPLNKYCPMFCVVVIRKCIQTFIFTPSSTYHYFVCVYLSVP